jgi:DNA repair protein RadC
MNNQYGTLELRVHRQVETPDSGDLLELLKDWGMNESAQESFWVITYDSSRNMRTVTEIARGSYRDVMVSIPTVMAAVHRSGSDRFIVVHNHPSGDKEATEMDMVLTGKIMDAANVSGLYFEDHVIVTPSGGHTSLVEAGLLVPAPGLSIKAREGAIKAKRMRYLTMVVACHD